MNPYQVLQISQTATLEEIKIAYRTLAKKYHPDINKAPDAQQLFAALNEAFETVKKHAKPARAAPPPPQRSVVDAPVKLYEFVKAGNVAVIDSGYEKILKDSVIFLMLGGTEVRIKLDKDYIVPFTLLVTDPTVIHVTVK